MYVHLIEDSPGEVRLTQEAFRVANASIRLHVAVDGVEAFAFLRRERDADAARPNFILFPTVTLTTSAHDADVVRSYQFQAKCYLNKPVHLDAFA